MVMQDRTAREPSGEPSAAGGRHFSLHRGSTAFGACGSLQRSFRVLQPVTAAVRAALGIAHRISLASRVISALRTLETGQFFSASLAIRAKAASSRFGTWARSVSADRL